jgi:hypothetical protein
MKPVNNLNPVKANKEWLLRVTYIFNITNGNVKLPYTELLSKV